jgi:hypothetical protein
LTVGVESDLLTNGYAVLVDGADGAGNAASGSVSNGLIELSGASIDAFGYAPDAIVLGLFDSLPGIVVGL